MDNFDLIKTPTAIFLIIILGASVLPFSFGEASSWRGGTDPNEFQPPPVSNPIESEPSPISNSKDQNKHQELCVYESFNYKSEWVYCDWRTINLDTISINTNKMQQFTLDYINLNRENPCRLDFVPKHAKYNYNINCTNSQAEKLDLKPLTMSNVDSAQQKSDNLLSICAVSHWDSNGLKPYMLYTIAGGEGSISENVGGIASKLSHDESYYWTEENLKNAIKMNIDGMLYNDGHADWGHRHSLLDPYTNKASIGISADDKCFSIVIHMETDYIDWKTFPIIIQSEGSTKIILEGTIESDFIQNIQLYDMMLILYPEEKPEKPSNAILTKIQDQELPIDRNDNVVYGYAHGWFCNIIICDSSYVEDFNGCHPWSMCYVPTCDPKIYYCLNEFGVEHAEIWIQNCNNNKCDFSITVNTDFIDSFEDVPSKKGDIITVELFVWISDTEWIDLTSISLTR